MVPSLDNVWIKKKRLYDFFWKLAVSVFNLKKELCGWDETMHSIAIRSQGKGIGGGG
jgi:hypothetical protein